MQEGRCLSLLRDCRFGPSGRACTLSLASSISAPQSASALPPTSINGNKAAIGVSAAPSATEAPTRAAIGPAAGCTRGDLNVPWTTIGPRSARMLGRFDFASSVRS
jgi:hypothetical protein